jgi:hypothetical protein
VFIEKISPPLVICAALHIPLQFRFNAYRSAPPLNNVVKPISVYILLLGTEVSGLSTEYRILSQVLPEAQASAIELYPENVV